MSVTYAAVVPLITAMIAAAAAQKAGLPGAAPMLVGGAAALATLAAWAYSPLKHSYGFGASADPTAGHWGFGHDDGTDTEPTEPTTEDTT